MDQIFPKPVDDVDVLGIFGADERPVFLNRPWVMCNMISTIDGAIALDGLSGGLGGPGDKAVFSAIRSVADVIIAGAGTVIAENYRRPQAGEQIQQLRQSRGQTALPRIAIVSASLRIDPNHRVFDADAPPIVITHAQSPETARSALAEVSDIIIAGQDTVDLPLALEKLRANGAGCVLVEGGPTLNGSFVDHDLIDEWCATSSPLIVGGTGSRSVAASNNVDARQYRLDRTLHHDGFLFHRYVRLRPNTNRDD